MNSNQLWNVAGRVSGKEADWGNSRSFVKELLYMKFLQGIPVVGAVGGGSTTRFT